MPHRHHGGSFRYTSANADLVGWILERAGGRRFSEMASSLLWKPMGAEEGAWITIDREGSPRCTGGMGATVRDLARLGQLLLDGGRGVVSRDWIADVEQNGDREAWATGEWARVFTPIAPSMSYRSGWYVIDGPPKLVFAMGIHGQNLFVDRDSRMVVAKVSSWDRPIDYEALALTHASVDAFRRCLAG